MKKKLILFANFFALWLRSLFAKPEPNVTFSNIGEGSHEHGISTFTADAATTERYLLYQVGTDADHSAVAATSVGTVLGFSDDQADSGLPIAIKLCGAFRGTTRAVWDGQGTTPTTGSKMGPSTTTAGRLVVTTTTNLVVGIAVVRGDQSTLAAGDVIEVIPTPAMKLPF